MGEGAELFADEQGFARVELLTEEAARLYREALAAPADGDAHATREARPESDAYRTSALALMRRLGPHDGPWGTIDVLALDAAGELVAGVSTSGFPWKYPGRVGDSPLPGAGLYADQRHGAAACTGRGEATMRIVGAKLVVDALAEGLTPEAACRRMIEEAAALVDPFASDVRALCLTPDGRHAAASLQPGAAYHVMIPSDDGVATLPAQHP